MIGIEPESIRARWKRLFRSRIFYLKLVSSMLLLTLLPLFLISSVLFINTQKAFERQIEEASLRYLRQTANAFEIIKDQIDSSFKQLILDAVVAEYESFPDGALLETAARSGAVGPRVSEYLAAKNRVYNKINSLRLSNRFIHSVYFYDGAKDTVLTDGWIQYPLHAFHDRSWRPLLDGLEDRSFAWISRFAAQRFGPEVRVITVLLPSFAEGNAFVINLNTERLYWQIMRNSGEAGATSTFLIARDGTVLLADHRAGEESPPITPDILRRAIPPDGSDRHVFMEGESLVSAVASPSFRWTSVGVTNLDELYRNVHILRRFFVVTTTGILILLAFLSVVATSRLYDPIRHLIRYLGDVRRPYPERDSGVGGTAGRGGEIGYIRDSIRENIRERRRLQARLRESIPAYREKLIHTLLERNSYSPNQIRARLVYAGIDMALENIAVVAIATDAPDESPADPQEAGIRRLRMLDTVRGCIRARAAGDVTEIDENRLVALVNTGGRRMNDVFLCAEAVRRNIAGTFRTGCTIGIGSSQQRIEDLHTSYREAIEALKHGLLAGRGEIIHIHDIRIGRVRKNYEPIENRIATMQDFVKIGETEAAHAVLQEIAAELSSQTRDGPYREVQKILVEILISFIDGIEEMGGDWNRICPEHDAPFDTLTRMTDVREVFQWYSRLVERCSGYISRARSNRGRSYAARVREFLEEDCGRNVNLNSIADRLDLNPAYLGRVFKEEVGVHFVEYLTSVRISRSRELLLTTDMTVEEIGREVGYSNAYYFIKLFKGLTGTTPGKYRRNRDACVAAAEPSRTARS